MTTNELIERLGDIKREIPSYLDRDTINEACALLADHAKMRPLFRKLIGMLDAALPLLDKAAEKERKAQAGQILRAITHQVRARAAREAVADAMGLIGYLP